MPETKRRGRPPATERPTTFRIYLSTELRERLANAQRGTDETESAIVRVALERELDRRDQANRGRQAVANDLAANGFTPEEIAKVLANSV